MAKTAGQKLKLLYLVKILTEETDEQHVLQMAELAERLQGYGIMAERKALYDDIAQLQQFGYDILYRRSREKSGYYLGAREFELAELKLLVDAIQASRFMSAKKSRELIAKLEKFAGREGARQLQRQVYVAGRIKSGQENIYYNVDAIHRALQEQVQICFIYMEWGMDGALHPKREGALYQVSPWAVLWSSENYYLIGYDGPSGKIKHYRVDKMQQIRLLEREKRQGSEAFADFDLAAYANRTFGMYGGKVETVTICMENRLAGVIMDRFGSQVRLRPVDQEHFKVRVSVAVSSQFFGWLTGLGTGARLTGPDWVCEEYSAYLAGILQIYKQGAI